ncbi:hypothetical protein CR513_39760, partial [Mucuna pruriens]
MQIPPERLVHGHVRDVRGILGWGGRGNGSIRASFVETELHSPRQARFFFFFFGVEGDERGGVWHESHPLHQVLVDEEGQDVDVRFGQQHGLRERFGQQADGGVHLVGAHHADREGSRPELVAVEEALQGGQAAELVVGEEATAGEREGGVRVRRGREFESGEGARFGCEREEACTEREGLDLRIQGQQRE